MKPISFRIVGLNVDSFNIFGVKRQEGALVEVRTSYEFGINSDAHMVMARITYQYMQGESEMLQMTLTSSFDVKSDEFQTLRKGNLFTLEPYFTQYLCTINVGAARGEIHARCEQQNSELANVILPPINLTEALPNPITIEIQK